MIFGIIRFPCAALLFYQTMTRLCIYHLQWECVVESCPQRVYLQYPTISLVEHSVDTVLESALLLTRRRRLGAQNSSDPQVSHNSALQGIFSLSLPLQNSDWVMSKFGRKIKQPPEGFDYVEPTLTALDNELRESKPSVHSRITQCVYIRQGVICLLSVWFVFSSFFHYSLYKWSTLPTKDCGKLVRFRSLSTAKMLFKGFCLLLDRNLRLQIVRYADRGAFC